MCKICGSHSIFAENTILLGCDNVLLSEYFQTFRKIIVSSPSELSISRRIFGAEDEGTTIL
jgi:hypothetical protein